MKNRFLFALILLLLLSTYNMQDRFSFRIKPTITDIQIYNNKIIEERTIHKKLSFLYSESLFFLKTSDVKDKLNEISFIDSFEIRRIYPNILKIKIYEKKPVVILQDKKDKYYYTLKGDIINFIYYKKFENLPIVFANKENFKTFYSDLKKIKFSLSEIKKIYFFESQRWDLLTNKDKLIKLPTNNYLESLNNFIAIKDLDNFEKYKIFDYRINNQLILK